MFAHELGGFGARAAREEHLGELDLRLGVRGLELERAPQRRLVAGRDERVGLTGHEGVEEALDLRGRQRADELVDDPPVAERLDGGDALDAEGLRDARVGVGVELGEHDLALARVRGLLEQRAEHATRPAPLGPEVDDDGELARALDDLALEVLFGDIDDGHEPMIGLRLWNSS
jgi:hypothetical protein